MAEIKLWRFASQQIRHDLAGDCRPTEAAAVEAGGNGQTRRKSGPANQWQAIRREAHDSRPAANDAHRLEAREERRQAGCDAGQDGRADPFLIVTETLVFVQATEPSAQDL